MNPPPSEPLPLRPAAAPWLAALHEAALPGLLQRLGPAVLRAFYRAALAEPSTLALAVGEQGYVLGTTEAAGYYRRLVWRSPALAAALVAAVARQPGRLRHLRGGQAATGPELLFLAVRPEARGQGLGRALVAAFAGALAARGRGRFELTVNADNEAALAFYHALGCAEIGRYEEYGLPRLRLAAQAAQPPSPGPPGRPRAGGASGEATLDSTAGVTVAAQDLTDAADWDRFVVAHPDGAFTHLSGHLLALRAATGYRVEALAARAEGRLVGLLPWAVSRSGRAVSLPFYEFGGPLLADDAPAGALAALLAAAGPVELRVAGGWRSPFPPGPRWNLGELAVLDLTAEFDAGYDRSLRKALRRAERLGVEVVRGACPHRLAGDFYEAYRRWLRDRHGTPPLARRYFAEVGERLAGGWRLFEAWHRGRVVARLLGFGAGANVAITAILSDPADGSLRAVDAVHHAFVRWAAERGFERFWFGAVRYEGQRRYKLKWGCRLVPFEQLGGRPPASPEGRAAMVARGLWRRLPLAAGERLGPPLRDELTL